MWTTREIARWDGLAGAAPGSYRLHRGRSRQQRCARSDRVGRRRDAHLAGGRRVISCSRWPRRHQAMSSRLSISTPTACSIWSAWPAAAPTRWLGKGTAGYHWKVIRPRAQQNAGDQRINSFGVGGDIQVRSGLLVQTQVLTGAPVHFGLGTHTTIDVARIVWPNGVAQAEFRGGVDDAIVAEQRLKGSCPWVFAWDGQSYGLRHRLPVAVAARPAHQRAGHSGRDADGRLGADCGRAARAAQRRVRRPHHRGAVGDALLRSRLAARCRSSSGHRGVRR